ncbi:hypothetical protein EYF80_036177 [Liparis tanakae]|uniref:Uncharacterized protein n=1 Tax=Liparis tanakae TaxID=230148 RepID=A0A4Z2GLC9_9TELE|nr:hypothetical protein EYF80_036177 [Liparis tanakae]
MSSERRVLHSARQQGPFLFKICPVNRFLDTDRFHSYQRAGFCFRVGAEDRARRRGSGRCVGATDTQSLQKKKTPPWEEMLIQETLDLTRPYP